MKRRELKKAVVLIKLLPLLGLGVSGFALADDASKNCPDGTHSDFNSGLCVADSKSISDVVRTGQAAPVASVNTPADSSGPDVPQAATQDPPAAPAPGRAPRQVAAASTQDNPDRYDGMNLAQLKATFPYFSTRTSGKDPNQEIVLNGTVFDDCRKDFVISNSMSNPSDADLSQGNRLGFKISDPNGAGRACMKSHAHDVCSSLIPCDYLSADPNAHMKLSGSVADSDIGIVQRDLMAPPGDPTSIKFDDIATHHSSATLKAEFEARKKAANDAMLKQAQRELQVCNKSQDELDVAGGARDTICAIPGIAPAECTKAQKQYDADAKKSVTNQLAALTKEAAKVKLSDDDAIADLSDRLQEFANDNENTSDQVAKIMADLTNRLVSAKNAGDDQFAEARLLVDSAQGLPDLSDAVSARLAQYPMQIDMLQLQKKAQSGNVDQATFMPAYQSLMKEAYNNIQSNCQMSTMSQSGIPAGCSNAIQMMNSAQKIPQQYAQAVQQQYSFQQSVNQAIYGAQAQMSSPTGFFGTANQFQTNTLNPYAVSPMMGAGTTPQLVGGTPISSPTWR